MPTNPADIRKAALLAVATLAAGFVAPIFPYGGLPLAAFALGWLTFRYGPGKAALLAAAAAGCVAFFGPALIGTAPLDGVFVGVTLLALGPAAAIALRRYSALNVVVGVALVVTVAFLVAPIGALTLKESLVVWKQLLDALASSGSTSFPATTTAALLAQMSTTWPATVFYTMGVSSALGVWLVVRAARLLGQEVHGFPALADTEVTFHVIWPTIAGLGLTAAASLWSQTPHVFEAIGANALMIVRPVLFLQGAAVFGALYRKAGAGRLSRAIGIVLLVLTETFIPSISILGAVDLFANLRRIPRAGGSKPAAVS